MPDRKHIAWRVEYEYLAATTQIGKAKPVETWGTNSFVTDDKDFADSWDGEFDAMGNPVGRYRNKRIVPLVAAPSVQKGD